MRILFLDDQPHGLEAFLWVLKRAHHEVDLKTSTKDARDAIANRPYDIVILDLSMPPDIYSEDDPFGATTGLHFLKDLRKRYPLTPVLVFTNVGDPEILAQLTGQPRVKVLGKLDVMPQDFAAIVEAFVPA